MPTRANHRSPRANRKPIILAFLVAAMTLPLPFTANGGGFELYYPPNEQLRLTIMGVWESQAFRPPAVLVRSVSEALRSIKEIEGRADQRLARLLSSRLKGTWADLEHSRVVSGLGYDEFDEEAFQAADAKFQEIVTQFLGGRASYPEKRYHAVLQALSDAQALSRSARHAVPGLSSDDILLTRDKRQKLLLKEPSGEGGMTPRFGLEAVPTR